MEPETYQTKQPINPNADCDERGCKIRSRQFAWNLVRPELHFPLSFEAFCGLSGKLRT